MPDHLPFPNPPTPMPNLDQTVDSSPSFPGGENEPPPPLSPLTRTHIPGAAAVIQGGLGMIGSYKLLQKLGEGGMGTVYLAEDVMLHRQVALKVMKPNIAAEPISRERFLREARAAAQLEHDNIVAIHQISEENGVPFLAMPLLRGESLGKYLERTPRPDLAFIIKIGRDVALGLAAAHSKGLVHRDIKPDNIWIEPITSETSTVKFRAKILDFGLARPRQDEEGVLLTRQGAFLGTPAYVAPEQARGLQVDQRADLFSLGCVLYEMCAGRRPFTGTDTMAVLTSLISDTPTEPGILNVEVPPMMSQIVMLLLQKDPTRRPASAAEVADALRQVQPGLLSSMPGLVSARLPVVRPPVQSAARREWIGGLFTLLLGLLVLGGIGAGIYFAWKYLPKGGDGTLVIEVEDAVLTKWSSAELRVYDAGNQLKKSLKPNERRLTLPDGIYRLKLSGVEGLYLVTGDGIKESTSGREIDIKIEPGATTSVKVTANAPRIPTSTGPPDRKLPDPKDLK